MKTVLNSNEIPNYHFRPGLIHLIQKKYQDRYIIADDFSCVSFVEEDSTNKKAKESSSAKRSLLDELEYDLVETLDSEYLDYHETLRNWLSRSDQKDIVPHWPMIYQLCDFFDCSLEELLHTEDYLKRQSLFRPEDVVHVDLHTLMHYQQLPIQYQYMVQTILMHPFFQEKGYTAILEHSQFVGSYLDDYASYVRAYGKNLFASDREHFMFMRNLRNYRMKYKSPEEILLKRLSPYESYTQEFETHQQFQEFINTLVKSNQLVMPASFENTWEYQPFSFTMGFQRALEESGMQAAQLSNLLKEEYHLNISQKRISNWRCGKYDSAQNTIVDVVPSLDVLSKLCAIFDCDLDYLFYRSPLRKWEYECVSKAFHMSTEFVHHLVKMDDTFHIYGAFLNVVFSQKSNHWWVDHMCDLIQALTIIPKLKSTSDLFIWAQLFDNRQNALGSYIERAIHRGGYDSRTMDFYSHLCETHPETMDRLRALCVHSIHDEFEWFLNQLTHDTAVGTNRPVSRTTSFANPYLFYTDSSLQRILSESSNTHDREDRQKIDLVQTALSSPEHWLYSISGFLVDYKEKI